MLEFIQVEENDEIYCRNIFDILKKCGEDMYKREGLSHWYNPYSLERIKEDVVNKRVFLVKSDKSCIATFALDDIPSKFFNDNKKYIYLSKFAVLPSKSGKGIGKKCLEYIEDKVNEEKFEGIRLDVYERSINAIRFYKKNGFKDCFIGSTTNFNVICMEKEV